MHAFNFSSYSRDILFSTLFSVLVSLLAEKQTYRNYVYANVLIIYQHDTCCVGFFWPPPSSS